MTPIPQKSFVIAEMACSHEGELALGKLIVDGAGRSGADAIQFQIWDRHEMVIPTHRDWDLLTKLQLSRDEWRALADHAREHYPAMEIIACVYEEQSAEWAARELEVEAFKLHTADLSNPALVRHVAQYGKRIDLSVGASTIEEILAALEWIRAVDTNAVVWMMYGYQGFPTPTDRIRLEYMRQLQGLFGLPVGYQDHSAGGDPGAYWLPAAAFGMGIRIFEKHITHDRSKKGVDHQAALNPDDEFPLFVEMLRILEGAAGEPGPAPFSADEERYRRYSKKSLVAARDLQEGTILSAEDLRAMRANDLGLPPALASNLLGRTVKRAIPAYSLVTEGELA